MPSDAVHANARRILDQVVDAGAVGDLIVQEKSSLTLKAHAGELEEHNVNSSRIYGVRVIKDSRVGIAYSEAADSAALRSMVEQALLNATFARPDANEGIAAGALTLTTDDAILCPPDDTSTEAKIDAALTIERELTARDKVQNVPHNGVQDVTRAQHIFATNGLSAHSKSRLCGAFAYALLKDGDNDVLDGVQRMARRFDDVDTGSVVDETYQRCLALLHGEPVASKHYDVLFDVECQAALFEAFADMMFSGKTARDGINPLRDKVGTRIAVDTLTIRDAPLRTDGFHYALFDDEGTPTSATSLIEAGRLETLAHNRATSTHLGLANTGHGARTPRSPLGVALHQPEICAGDVSEAALTAGEYLEIVDLAGLHSGANSISGDFSFGAAGFLCANGERRRPVRNITVAGNFYAMLNKIAAIGDTQHWNAERSALMAPIRFGDVAISG